MRGQLFALYAFNFEIAKIAENVRNAIAGQMRFQWWRNGIEEIYAGGSGPTGVLKQLGSAIAAHHLPKALFEAILDARELDLETAPFPDADRMKAYCDAGSGNLMRLAARILGAAERLDEAAADAGIAYAVTGLLRALAFNAARSRIILPALEMAKAGVSSRDILAGRMTPETSALIAEMAGLARAHFARIARTERRYLPAILPAALVPAYCRMIMQPGIDPFRNSTEIPGYRRQLILLRAVLRGRL